MFDHYVFSMSSNWKYVACVKRLIFQFIFSMELHKEKKWYFHEECSSICREDPVTMSLCFIKCSSIFREDPVTMSLCFIKSAAVSLEKILLPCLCVSWRVQQYRQRRSCYHVFVFHKECSSILREDPVTMSLCFIKSATVSLEKPLLPCLCVS